MGTEEGWAVEPRLSDQVAVVTGGGQGIGRAISLRLARQRARVVIGDLNPATAQKVAAEIQSSGGQAIAVQADVIFSPQVDQLVQEAIRAFGKIDIWVNNVGGRRNTRLSKVADMEEELWDAVIANNLKATFLGCRAAAREMIKRGAGKIINYFFHPREDRRDQCRSLFSGQSRDRPPH